jgi:hypothetical protein
MSQSRGTEDAPTLLLRLSLPANGGFRAFASDLAAKVGEYLGQRPSDAKATAAAIDSLAAKLESRDDKAEITFEFHQLNGELRIEARCEGRSSEARYPLPT